MDPSNDIREFLVSRRARITPEEARLPAYGGNRRVKGLRREEVALRAGISAEYYVRLERGNVGGASEEVLDGRPAQEGVRPVVPRIVDSIVDAPEFVRNERLDVLGANELGDAFHGPMYGSHREAAPHGRQALSSPCRRAAHPRLRVARPPRRPRRPA